LAPDRALVAARLALIDEAIRFLESVAQQDHEIFSNDARTYRAAERYLHLASEAVFDIGTHLIASLGLSRPDRYADVMPILREAGLVSAETAATLADLAGFRNLLVHSYARVDRERLHVFCRTRLDDFKRFAADVGRAIAPGPG
jgi:uncharacterized protein YutE (UPF0331/DUF86 family)